MAHLKKLFRFNLTQSCSHSQSSLSLLAGGVWHEEKEIDHFTVVCSMTPTLNGSEAGVHPVPKQNSLPLLCKTSCSNAN